MARYRQRDYPRVFRLMLTHHEPDEQVKRRDAANPYKRQALRHAFTAGWLAQDLGMDLPADKILQHTSRLALAAMRRGVDARLDHTAPTTGGKTR